MNQSICSTNLKKIYLFLQNLAEGHFFFSQSNFYFADLFFSNSFCCEWRPCGIKFGAGCTCHRIFSDTVQVSFS